MIKKGIVHSLSIHRFLGVRSRENQVKEIVVIIHVYELNSQSDHLSRNVILCRSKRHRFIKESLLYENCNSHVSMEVFLIS